MTQPVRPVDHRPLWGRDAAGAAAMLLTIATVWGVAKLLAIWAWVVMPGEYGDTYYYFLAAEEVHAAGGGVAAALREYPTPAGLLLLWPYELGATGYEEYRTAVIWMTTVADAAFAVLLGRRLGPAGALAWVGLTTSLGQLALLRFDMLPAVVAGAAVLLAMEGRRVGASVLVGLGTGLKLWPIVLFPLALGRVRASDPSRPRRRWTPILAFAVTGVVLVAISLATGGWDRLLSPLSYQRDRGLQIEAVPATAPMFEWASDEAYRVWFSTFHAFEVTGPTIDTWLGIAQVASIGGALGCVALLAWWFWRGAPPTAIGWLALVLVGTFVVTSRALSPQYLLWLAAPAAVLVGVALRQGAEPGPGAAEGPGAEPRPGAAEGSPAAPSRVLALLTFALLLVLCALTTAVYPVYYGGITGRGDTTQRALRLLALRNLGLLVLVAWSAVCSVVESGHRRARSQTPSEQPRRPGPPWATEQFGGRLEPPARPK